MDKKKQSILKPEGRIPLQEMGLPDFPDDDTGTVTVTKSRRVSFGANFVKEFIVGSAISTQFYSEYEQAFSSSDSSNPNSSHSGLLNQSSCHDNAINLCVKPTAEDEYTQVKKKLCLEKQPNSHNIVNERCNDGNWEFNVSNNSNIFSEKSNIVNRSDNVKHVLKDIKRSSHNDSFVSGEKYFQSKQGDSELNSSKFNDNLEKKSKPGKFSSTICFSVDSPTADMEFTEGCISLAKSIFDKKNKEMTVYIQEKKGNDKKEGKTNSSDVIFDGSEVEMSLTKCVNDQSEDDSFLGNKLCGFEGQSSGIQSSGSDELRGNIENIPIHMYPLNVLLNQNNKSEEDSLLERSLFFPERSLTEMLNPGPLKTTGFNDDSLEKDNNEECNMELSICEPLKIYTSNETSLDKNNEQCNADLPNNEPLKTFLANSHSLEKHNMELSSPEDLKIPAPHDHSLDKANNEKSDIELSICGPLTQPLSNNSRTEEDNEISDMELSICGPLTQPLSKNSKTEEDSEKSDMELSICGPLIQPLSNNSKTEEDNEKSDMELSICGPLTQPLSNTSKTEEDNEKSDMELSICKPGKTPLCNSPTVGKCNIGEGDMILSTEPLKTLISNDKLSEEENIKGCNLELLTSDTFKTAISNDCAQVNSNSKDYDVDLSPPEQCKMTSINGLALDGDNNEECKMELLNSEPSEIVSSDHPALDNDEVCTMQLSTSEPLQVFLPDHPSQKNENSEECNMELSISAPLKIHMSCTAPLDNDSNEVCNVELPIPQPSGLLVSMDSAPDNDSVKKCRTELSPCGHLQISASNDLSMDSEITKDYNMELSTSERLKIFTREGNPGDECNGGDHKEETVEDTKQEENNETEKSSKENKYPHCQFMHVDMETMENLNREPEVETCVSDPLSVSACPEDVSLSDDKNKNFDVEMMDSSSVRIFTYDRSLREQADHKEENDEIVNCSKDSSFLEVMKEVAEEVNNGSFIKKSVIELFRSTVIDTDLSLNENYNQEKTLPPLNAQFSLESPVKKSQEKNKAENIKKISDEPRTIHSVSEGDKKIIALLREQSEETNCLWKIESFAHDGDSRFWSFSSSLLGSLVIMKFRLTPPKDMSVVSFSFIAERNIELLKPKEYQSEKNKTAVDYAFEKMKNYFDPESRGLDNVHKIPLFLDRMNYFLIRINKVVDQLLRIMKEYPGSRVKKSILSFRLYSFPLMFSLSVMVDVNDPLQLSENCVTFEKHFGNFSTTHIKSVFNDCLKSEEVLIQFIRRSVQLIISEERVLGCVTNRSHIRLIT